MSGDRRELAGRLNAGFAALTPLERLRTLVEEAEGPVVFTTSLGIEDQMIAHLIFSNDLPIQVKTLDTGRLFPETYTLWRETEEKYGHRIKAMYPQAEALEALVDDQGIDGFYHAPEFRKNCCGVRKIEPLSRALVGAAGWITGLRRDQSANRSDMDFVSFDTVRGLIKANPVFDWTRAAIVAFTADHDVPVNALHARNFLSIGCAPCTRAIRPGEPERAGRWGWEEETRRECGLHVDDSGRPVRNVTHRSAKADDAFESLRQ